jgi:S1-C subfamily serine protease
MRRSFLSDRPWLLAGVLSSAAFAWATAGNAQTPAAAAAAEGEVSKNETAPQPIDFETIDDLGLKAAFEKQLGALKDAGKTADPKELQKQLNRTRAGGIELETVPDRVLQASAIYDNAKSATLIFGNIYKCDRCDKWHGGMAGGVLLTSDGVAVTNYHVMENNKAGAFGAMTADGSMHAVLEVLAASKKDDVALVRLAGENFPSIPVSIGDDVGSEVRVISHPDGRFFSYSEGVIARYFTDRKNRAPRMQITADYARGSSGSGVFNEAGALTGLVSATTSIYYHQSKEEHDNLQMVIKSCIPVAAIWDLLEKKIRR